MFANCLNSNPSEDDDMTNRLLSSSSSDVPTHHHTPTLSSSLSSDPTTNTIDLTQSGSYEDRCFSDSPVNAAAVVTAAAAFMFGAERRFMSARDRKKCLRNPSTIEDLVYSINNEFNGVFDDDDDDDDDDDGEDIDDADDSKSSIDENGRLKSHISPTSMDTMGINQYELHLPNTTCSSSSSQPTTIPSPPPSSSSSSSQQTTTNRLDEDFFSSKHAEIHFVDTQDESGEQQQETTNNSIAALLDLNMQTNDNTSEFSRPTSCPLTSTLGGFISPPPLQLTTNALGDDQHQHQSQHDEFVVVDLLNRDNHGVVDDFINNSNNNNEIHQYYQDHGHHHHHHHQQQQHQHHGLKRKIEFENTLECPAQIMDARELILDGYTGDNSGGRYMSKKHKQLRVSSSEHIPNGVDSSMVMIDSSTCFDELLMTQDTSNFQACQQQDSSNVEPTLMQLVKLSSSAIPTSPTIIPTNKLITDSSSNLSSNVLSSTQPPPQTDSAISPSSSSSCSQPLPSVSKQQQSTSSNKSRPRPKNLPDRAVEIMLAWWNEHIENPFPSENERLQLAQAGEISATQVRQWFANRRMRAAAKKTRPSGSNSNSNSSISGGGVSLSSSSPLLSSSSLNSSGGGGSGGKKLVTQFVDINNNVLANTMVVNKNSNSSVVPVGPNELEKYTESIDFVIKSVDDELKSREAEQQQSNAAAMNNMNNIISELHKLEQHNAKNNISTSQFQAPKKPARFSRTNLTNHHHHHQQQHLVDSTIVSPPLEYVINHHQLQQADFNNNNMTSIVNSRPNLPTTTPRAPRAKKASTRSRASQNNKSNIMNVAMSAAVAAAAAAQQSATALDVLVDKYQIGGQVVSNDYSVPLLGGSNFGSFLPCGGDSVASSTIETDTSSSSSSSILDQTTRYLSSSSSSSSSSVSTQPGIAYNNFMGQQQQQQMINSNQQFEPYYQNVNYSYATNYPSSPTLINSMAAAAASQSVFQYPTQTNTMFNLADYGSYLANGLITNQHHHQQIHQPINHHHQKPTYPLFYPQMSISSSSSQPEYDTHQQSLEMSANNKFTYQDSATTNNPGSYIVTTQQNVHQPPARCLSSGDPMLCQSSTSSSPNSSSSSTSGIVDHQQQHQQQQELPSLLNQPQQTIVSNMSNHQTLHLCGNQQSSSFMSMSSDCPCCTSSSSSSGGGSSVVAAASEYQSPIMSMLPSAVAALGHFTGSQQQFKCDTPPPMNVKTTPSRNTTNTSPSTMFLPTISNIISSFPLRQQDEEDDDEMKSSLSREANDQQNDALNYVISQHEQTSQQQQQQQQQQQVDIESKQNAYGASLAHSLIKPSSASSSSSAASSTHQPINQVTFTNIRFHHGAGAAAASGQSTTTATTGKNHPFSNLNVAPGSKISTKQTILTSTKPISISLSQLRSLQQEQKTNETSQPDIRFSDSRAKEWCMNSHPRLASSLLLSPSSSSSHTHAIISGSSSNTSSNSNLENHQEEHHHHHHRHNHHHLHHHHEHQQSSGLSSLEEAEAGGEEKIKSN